MRLVLAILCAMLTAPAFSQPCLPSTEAAPDAPHIWQQPAQNVAWIGTPMQWGLSTRGAWVRWYCAEVNGTGFVRVTRASLPADWANIGGRVRTIVTAADPLKSLQTAPSRINMLPLSDPQFAELLKDIK